MEECQKYECIYNRYVKDFKDKHKMSNAWKAVAEKFHITVDEIIMKFRNTRTSDRRCLNK